MVLGLGVSWWSSAARVLGVFLLRAGQKGQVDEMIQNIRLTYEKAIKEKKDIA